MTFIHDVSNGISAKYSMRDLIDIVVEAGIPKTEAYRRGRKAGGQNYVRDSNPYPNSVGEHGEWDIGWVDGYHDIGWSKPSKKPRVKQDPLLTDPVETETKTNSQGRAGRG